MLGKPLLFGLRAIIWPEDPVHFMRTHQKGNVRSARAKGQGTTSLVEIL